MTCPFNIGDKVACLHDGETGKVTLVMQHAFDYSALHTGTHGQRITKARVFESGWKWYRRMRG